MHDLPDDPTLWKEIVLFLPRLSPDTPEICPVSTDDVWQYVQMESSDVEHSTPSTFSFIRTAEVDGWKYWIWIYTESDGQRCYVFVRQGANGRVHMSLLGDKGLSPEQFVLADYYGLILLLSNPERYRQRLADVRANKR